MVLSDAIEVRSRFDVGSRVGADPAGSVRGGGARPDAIVALVGAGDPSPRRRRRSSRSEPSEDPIDPEETTVP